MSNRSLFTDEMACRANLLPVSLDAEQFDFKDERRVGRNLALALRAIAEIGRNDELAFAAHLHAQYAFIPAANDRAGAEAKLVRLAAIYGAVEFAAVGERAGVMHDDGSAELRLIAGADDFVHILEARRRGDFSAAFVTTARKRHGATDEESGD